jgi:pimeloyl-ACP methyl ester carboxylesterase
MVVLVHGIATPRWVLKRIASRLERYGFRAVPWFYPSLFKGIEHHAERLRRFLLKAFHESGPIHVVAHSMGCIVSMVAIAGLPDQAIGRIVWIAPPIRGSPIARFLTPVLGRLFPPISQLSSSKGSWVNHLNVQIKQDVGIISGAADWLVQPPYTAYNGKEIHLALFASHNSLLFSDRVIAEISSFLSVGAFQAGARGCDSTRS